MLYNKSATNWSKWSLDLNARWKIKKHWHNHSENYTIIINNVSLHVGSFGPVAYDIVGSTGQVRSGQEDLILKNDNEMQLAQNTGRTEKLRPDLLSAKTRPWRAKTLPEGTPGQSFGRPSTAHFFLQLWLCNSHVKNWSNIVICSSH